MQGTVIVMASDEDNKGCESVCPYEGILPPKSFGWLIIGVNWLPGLVSAMHILSAYRADINSTWKSLLMAIGAFVFYPIVPILLYIMTIWQADNDGQQPGTVDHV